MIDFGESFFRKKKLAPKTSFAPLGPQSSYHTSFIGLDGLINLIYYPDPTGLRLIRNNPFPHEEMVLMVIFPMRYSLYSNILCRGSAANANLNGQYFAAASVFVATMIRPRLGHWPVKVLRVRLLSTRFCILTLSLFYSSSQRILFWTVPGPLSIV